MLQVMVQHVPVQKVVQKEAGTRVTNKIQVCLVNSALSLLMELSIHNSAPSHFFEHRLIEAELQLTELTIIHFFILFLWTGSGATSAIH